MRHAYLIMAHNEFGILRRLIQMIDDERNDIYVHIDRKVRNFDFDAFSKIPKKSKIYFTKRIHVYWGHSSIVKCAYLLFKSPPPDAHYDYYHLLSGADLPLASQDEIHAFFDEHPGEEFVTLEQPEVTPEHLLERARYYRFFLSLHRHRRRKIRIASKALTARCLTLQKHLGVDRLKHLDLTIYKGSAWASITEPFLRYVLQNERRMRRICAFTIWPDEFFIQTLLYNSPFSANCRNRNLRCIDWDRSPDGSSPYTFREEDYDMLIHSGCFFARKFASSVSGRLPDMLYEHVMGAPAPDEL